MQLPKVLVVNQAFNDHTGSGITLSNFFAGWDKTKIAAICHHYLLDNVDTNVCNTYYQIGYKEHKFMFPFNFLKRKYHSGLLKFDVKDGQTKGVVKSRVRLKLIMEYFNPLLKYFGVNDRVSKLQLSNELRNWLDQFNPDIIYAHASGREGIKMILLIQQYLKKPLVFHMMDDWILADKAPLKFLRDIRNDREFRKLLDKSNVLMGISDAMTIEYQKRYGKNFISFHNPIDIGFWGKYQRTNYDLPGSPSILYAGRIGLGIDSSLELIAKTIQKVNKELKLPMQFILQTRERPAWVDNYSCVSHKGFVAYQELPKAFAEADFLILPYDFSSQGRKYIHYSMPTKATEYMISGTPIIVFSPQEAAVVAYANKYRWAKVVTENSIDSLYSAIKEMLKSKSEREMIAQNAIQTAKDKHAVQKVTEHFRTILCSAMNA